MKACIYEIATGQIVDNYIGALWTVGDQVGIGQDFIVPNDDFNDLDHYVIGDQIVARPEMPAIVAALEVIADGVDELRIYDIPIGAAAFVRGPAGDPEAATWHGDIDDGELLIRTEIAGAFVVTLDYFPYRQKVIEINAR